MKFMLKMKAWQVFTLVLCAPLLFMASEWIGLGPKWFDTFHWITTLVSAIILLGWFWALGSHINLWIPEDIRPSRLFFRFGLVFSLLFLAFFDPRSSWKDNYYALALMPAYFLGLFYAFYFVAKNLVMAEQKKKVVFNDFAESFFLAWLFPIGVWFIQPRVNRMFEQQENTQRVVKSSLEL